MKYTKEQIKEKNDNFRKYFSGKVLLTQGVNAREDKQEIMERVKNFDTFTEDNDPYGEHDFGAFEINGDKIFWKIDYYDENLEYGVDPHEEEPQRVLTIMLAEEY